MAVDSDAIVQKIGIIMFGKGKSPVAHHDACLDFVYLVLLPQMLSTIDMLRSCRDLIKIGRAGAIVQM